MKQRVKLLFALPLLILFLFITSTQAQVTLRIGDPAPAIKHSKWFKGTPVVNFEKGKIYVIEFWAIGCPPCMPAIPHLTELTRKYKDQLIIIGMNGVEENKTVEEFVNKMSDKMDYNVATDTENKFMINNWMTAAGQEGVPNAFIIGRDTKIAWIGHPMNLDEPLGQMIEGKYDLKAFAEKFGPRQEKEGRLLYIKNKFDELGKFIFAADETDDYAKVITESETLLVKEPLLQEKIYFYYFRSLLRVNPQKALTIAQNIDVAKLVEPRNNIIYRFTEEGLNKKVYDFAIGILQPICEKNPNDFNSMMNLALAYEYSGNKQKSVGVYEKMIAFGKANKLPASTLKSFEDKVSELKSKK